MKKEYLITIEGATQEDIKVLAQGLAKHFYVKEIVETNLSSPVLNPFEPIPMTKELWCGECNSLGIPENKIVFSTHKTIGRRQIKSSKHCKKCDFELASCQYVFENPDNEQAEKDNLVSQGRKWTEE